MRAARAARFVVVVFLFCLPFVFFVAFPNIELSFCLFLSFLIISIVISHGPIQTTNERNRIRIQRKSDEQLHAMKTKKPLPSLSKFLFQLEVSLDAKALTWQIVLLSI